MLLEPEGAADGKANTDVTDRTAARKEARSVMTRMCESEGGREGLQEEGGGWARR